MQALDTGGNFPAFLFLFHTQYSGVLSFLFFAICCDQVGFLGFGMWIFITSSTRFVRMFEL